MNENGTFNLSNTDLNLRDNLGTELYYDKSDILSTENFIETIEPSQVEFEWLPPVAKPGKVICIGRNYLEHITEQNKTPEESPLLFSKYPSNMTAHLSKIKKPSFGEHLDYEVELAVVIGKELNKDTPNVLDCIFGYTVANDLTMRDVQKSEKQWTRGKAFDNSLPIGPLIVTKEEIKDYKELEIWLQVNGDLRQQAKLKQMIYPIETLLKFISEAITLYPGDIVLTGTPSGVGFYMDPKKTLQPGDSIISGISEIGELRFTIV